MVKTDKCLYGCETNFYSGGGSKLNETARSYKEIASASKGIKGFKFVWFTDGGGWKSARRNLKETFMVLDDIYNIAEIEQGVMRKLFVWSKTVPLSGAERHHPLNRTYKKFP